MGYFVLERLAGSALRLVLAEEHSSQEHAVAALRQGLSDGSVVATGELLVCSTAGAVPVIVLRAAEARGSAREQVEPGMSPEVPPVAPPAVSSGVTASDYMREPAHAEPFRPDEMFPVLPGHDTDDTMPPAGSSLSLAPAQVFEGPAAQRFDVYLCADCVYFRTCPKSGRVEPGSCGAFQWRVP